MCPKSKKMSSELQAKLDYVNAYRENRLMAAQYVLENHHLFEELVSICFSPENKNNHKACWILEFVSYEELIWLQPHLDFLCSNFKIPELTSLRNVEELRLIYLCVCGFLTKQIKFSLVCT